MTPIPEENRLRYELTMQLGAEEYSDVIERLTHRGLPTSFVQTGGMNAALLIELETGQTLLVTDEDDALSWSRDEHRGWAVGLYASDDASGDAVRFESTEDSSVDALLGLVRRVLLPPR